MKTSFGGAICLLSIWAAIACDPPADLADLGPPTPCVDDIDCREDELCRAGECWPAGVTITTRMLPRATAGAPYRVVLEAIGGMPPYRWSVLAGSLPAGLRLDPAAGVLAGTPAAPGGHPLVFEVIDAAVPPTAHQAAIRLDVTDFATEVRQSRPVAWWRFDEPPGAPAALDATGNGHDGTYSLQGVTLARPHLGAGDRAAAFTGEAGVGVTVPPGGLSPAAISLEAVVQVGPNGATQARIIERSRAHSSGTQSHYGLSVDPRTRRVSFEVWTAGGEFVLPGATPIGGRPVHVVATYDGAAARLYLDGALDAEAPGRGDLIVNEAPIGIANQAARDRPLRGTLDELALYDRALTPEEVAAHFAALRPVDPAACEAIPWYPDRDGDRAGDPAAEAPACDPPPDHIPFAGDCDDADPDRRPGAPETCDAVDEDCDARVDEGVVPRAIPDCAEPACTPDGPACARCAPDHFIDAGACTPCAATCPDGTRLDGACDGTTREGTLSCLPCAPIPGCLEVICTDDADQTCARCEDGFHPAPDGTCTPCAPIPGCLAPRCTGPADSTCEQCLDGRYIDPAGRCAPCAACPDGLDPSGACDGTTRSDVIACAALPNLLQNGSFELPAFAPGGFLVYPSPDVFFWTLAGDPVNNNYRVIHPAAPCAGCAPTDGTQILLTGRDARGTHTIEQHFAAIQRDTTYTFSIDVRVISCVANAADPTSDGRCHGSIALVVPLGGTRYRTLARSDDFATLPPVIWNRVSVSFDSAQYPELVGRPLHARIEPTTSQTRFAFDRAIATADATRRAAARPSPADGARDVHRDTALDFLPATLAPGGHHVYLSRDSAAVSRGDAAALAGQVAAPPFAPPRLAVGETWYWRVDALGDPAAIPGPVWRFTVDHGRARDPMPAADGNGVAPDVTLRWTPGPYAAAVDGHDVYFSTDRAAVEQRRPEAARGRRSDPSFDPPGELVPGRTYYWRVDERNGAETWPGDLWSFVVFDGRGLAAEWRRGYAVWVEHAIRHVFPATRPPAFRGAPRVRLELARGEYESAQIITLPAPGRDLADLRVELGAIDGPAPDAIEVQWHVTGYLQQEPYTLGPLAVWADGAPDPATGGWWPDLLLDAPRVDVPPEHAQSLWITVYAPPGTPPGEYTGALTLRTDSGLPTTIPLDVIVWDFTLPPGAGHLRTAVGVNELPRWGDAAWYLDYKDAILRHRINPGTIWRADPFPVAELERFHDAGMNAWPVRRDIYSRPNLEAAFIAAQMAAVAASPLGRSLRSMAYFFGFDEVRPDSPRFDIITDEFGWLRANYPDLGRLTTASLYLPQFDPFAEMRRRNVNWLCPPIHYYSAALGETIRGPYNLDFQYWAYHANWELFHLLIRPRLDGWHLHRLGADGFLYYMLTHWEAENPAFVNGPIDPDAGAFVPFAESHDDHGASLLYPGTRRPITTARLSAIRDGFEDYEYLWLLAARLGDDAAAEAAARVAPDGEAWTYVTWDPAILIAARRAIAASLLRAETIADNPGFEAPGPDPDGWIIDGPGHRLVDAPDAIEGTRLLHLAPLAAAITATQPQGPVTPGARYAAVIEARPSPGARGHLVLTAGDEIVARSRDLDTLPPGAWASLAATFDAAARPDLQGAPLAVHVTVTAGAVDLDDLRLTVGPEPAREPTPHDGATQVKRTTGLTWSPSGDAHPTDGHDLYFGTDAALVAAGDPAVHVGPQTVGRWHPPAPLDPGQTYYWRVDTLGPAGRVQGSVWTFTTNDGRAHTPSPANGAEAPLDPLLRWLPGDDAIAHRVWFGTDRAAVEASEAAVFLGEGPDNQVEVGPLAPGDDFYWRVDEVTAAGVVIGPVWHFMSARE